MSIIKWPFYTGFTVSLPQRNTLCPVDLFQVHWSVKHGSKSQGHCACLKSKLKIFNMQDLALTAISATENHTLMFIVDRQTERHIHTHLKKKVPSDHA